jgi:hypothetical protein
MPPRVHGFASVSLIQPRGPVKRVSSWGSQTLAVLTVSKADTAGFSEGWDGMPGSSLSALGYMRTRRPSSFAMV